MRFIVPTTVVVCGSDNWLTLRHRSWPSADADWFCLINNYSQHRFNFISVPQNNPSSSISCTACHESVRDRFSSLEDNSSHTSQPCWFPSDGPTADKSRTSGQHLGWRGHHSPNNNNTNFSCSRDSELGLSLPASRGSVVCFSCPHPHILSLGLWSS